MTKRKFDNFIEKEMVVYPDTFCRLTIEDTRRLTKTWERLVVVTKKLENVRLHKFEQSLRTKPRKLLLINTNSYEGNKFI